MRGSTNVDGVKENEVLDFNVDTEDEARQAWQKSVSSDSNNIDWSISSVTDLTNEVTS